MDVFGLILYLREIKTLLFLMVKLSDVHVTLQPQVGSRLSICTMHAMPAAIQVTPSWAVKSKESSH